MTVPMPPTPALETPRLVLRPLGADDVPALQRRFARWDVVRFLTHVVPWPYPPDGAATYVVQCLEEMTRGELCAWAIVHKEGPAELIGDIDLRADDGTGLDHLGFWLSPEFHNRGLMTEAAGRVVQFAFFDLGRMHLRVTNAEANGASSRVQEKQGGPLIIRDTSRYVSGEGVRMVWIIERDAWLARNGST